MTAANSSMEMEPTGTNVTANYCLAYGSPCWCNAMYSLTCVGSIGNILTGAVILQTPELRNKPLFVYLTCLATVDQMILILLSLGCLPFRDFHPVTQCVLKISILWLNDIMNYVEMGIIFLLTIERFFLITNPLRIRHLCTQRRALRNVLVITVVIAMLTAVRIFAIEECQTFFPGNVPKLKVIIFTTYCSFHNLVSLSVLTISILIIYKLHQHRNIERSMRSTAIKHQTDVLLLATALMFVLLNWPLHVNDVIMAYEWLSANDVTLSKDPEVREILFIISKVNNCINFYMYTLTGHMFRDGLKQLMQRGSSKERRKSSQYYIGLRMDMLEVEHSASTRSTSGLSC
ncbi:cysteinyl leukotriene receptor 2 isoform X2 [Lingula anatina]|uniref:Cysteinyl leukotriene receptor 2 isoform X2 n=1 Tax=Lingula anatina TaxID=7574 RepID=A0A1S3IRS6_LINAN|nr:cysteinyl leukotriene receptor 2 isoform X2 [Lingula anatina]|eukprot:XP_013400234.1 cysteinyl leukotriene receptor 2 isoform X2 [Lingula anatina]